VHPVVVEAAYEVLADVFVAARPLSAGTVISKDDIYAVKQKTSRLPMGAITDKAGIEGKKIRLNVAEGVIIRSDYLSNASAVKKGSEVTVLVEGDNVLVSTKGVLRNDTAVGNVAHVICTASKKEVDGMLVSSDTVKVKI
jgi:flagella basal body P-ring formation protein FlgA